MGAKRRIGVLALQGAVSEHLDMVKRGGCAGLAVKNRADLGAVDALILPGGESTTLGRLIREQELEDDIRAFVKTRPLLGTCAGLILCARELVGDARPRPLGLMDISVERNGFGRQRESFEADLEVEGAGSIRAVFIRAPFIQSVGVGARVLASLDDKIVMAEQGNVLVTAFHPELADDMRIFNYFVAKSSGALAESHFLL
ncbi:MAG: pyridoxal 5'-phosphate synthase glutaminase subunit PdxT [Desulfovibrio sp.]|jgi:5'-phosphate synthase pdxT subunit|nr:pyridoxal 5'-phosphate synthase glutaminase subunit PdxT [Desulfovibrio sp.]